MTDRNHTVERQIDRNTILERIANLRARAEGTDSENEANIALNKAAKLMDTYQVAEAELALAEAKGEIKIEIVHRKSDTTFQNVGYGRRRSGNRHKVIATLYGLEKYTNTKVVMHGDGTLTFTGDRVDVELADYIVAVMKAALDNEYANYRKTTKGVGRGAKTAFQQAMAYRLSERLQKMARDRDEALEEVATSADIDASRKMIAEVEGAELIADYNESTALMIIDMQKAKAAQVETAFRSRHPRLGSARGFGASNNGTAHGAGRAAGDRVHLGRAVAQGGRKQLTA